MRSGRSPGRSPSRLSRTPACDPAGWWRWAIANQRETVCVWDPAHGRAPSPGDRLAGSPHGSSAARSCGPPDTSPSCGRIPACARSLLLGHQDPVAARERSRSARPRARGRRRFRDDRLLARLQAHRPTPDRHHERLPHAPLRHLRRTLGPRAARPLRRPAARLSRRSVRAPGSSREILPAALHGHAVPSRASPATSRRRCSARRACEPARARTPTGPARSCCSTPVLASRARPRACSPRSPGRPTPGPPTPWRRRSSRRAPPSSGCGTACRSSPTPPRPSRWPPR